MYNIIQSVTDNLLFRLSDLRDEILSGYRRFKLFGKNFVNDLMGIIIEDKFDEFRVILLFGMNFFHDFRIFLTQNYWIEFEIQIPIEIFCELIIKVYQVRNKPIP